MAFATKKYLDLVGLQEFYDQLKTYIDNGDATATSSGTANLALSYVSADKKIYLKKGSTSLGSVDCTDFIKDSFVKSGSVITTGSGSTLKHVLRLVLNTVDHPGTTATDTSNIDIDIDTIFSAMLALTTDSIKCTGNESTKTLTTKLSEMVSATSTAQSKANSVETALNTEKSTRASEDQALYAAFVAITNAEIDEMFA